MTLLDDALRADAERQRFTMRLDGSSGAVLQGALQEAEAAQEPRRSGITAVELRDFLALTLPAREYLIHPIIPRQGLVMIHGPRGLGKTYVSLGIAYAVASAGKFLKWQAPTANGVLFIDGEMPAKVLQERLSRIVAANEQEASAPLKIITPDLNIETGLPDLSSAKGQAAIDAHVDESVGLIILDNLSSLARSGVENDAESWLPLQTWALRHRAAGRSVLFVHHSGKGGAQRGTSRREDVLDTVIGLRKPVDYCPEQGAHFEVHVEKARGFYGDEAKSFDAQLTTDAAGNQSWTLSDLEQSTETRIIELFEDGLKPNDIAQELRIGRATVYRQLKKAGLELKKSNGKVVPFKPR